VTNVVDGNVRSYVVAGWFTPDYRHYLAGLIADLTLGGHPYFFEALEKNPSGWAANTRMKAAAILRAMDRHPGVKLIWLDVDCRVIGDISPLLAIESDFAAHFKSRQMKLANYRYAGEYRAVVHPWSGTMVVSPTSRARKLIEAWRDAETDAIPLDPDETTLGLALARVPGLTVTFLHHNFCSSPGHTAPNAIIQHSSARLCSEVKHDRVTCNNTRVRHRTIRAVRRHLISTIVGKPYAEWKQSFK
jgi:hypothetical protein